MNTHWKKLTNPDYIGAYELQPGEKKTVLIESVSQELVTSSDGKKETCIVARLKGEKPFILNKTNCKTITKIYETPYIEQWAGKRITIYSAKVRAFGETVEALRIEQTKPELPELTPTHPKWADAKKAMEAGSVTIEQIKANYKLSKKHEDELRG